MINGKKTPLEQQREEEYKPVKDKFRFIVVNALLTATGTKTVEVICDNVEEVIHKVKLNLMGYAKHGNTDVSMVIKLINKEEAL